MAALCFAVACKKNKNSDPETSWTYSYTYQEGKMIDSFRVDTSRVNLIVSGGHNRVFTFSQEAGQNNQVVDDEYSAFVRFEVDSAATAFSETDAGLKNLTAFYAAGGAGGGYPSTRLTNGTISGQQTDATHWQVHIDVTLPTEEPQSGRRHIVEDAAFVLAP